MSTDPLHHYAQVACSNVLRDFVVQRQIDSGNSATVYLATSGKSESIAIKIYKPAFFEGENELVERRRIEDQLKLVNHACPSLIRLYGAGAVEDTYYVAMEYVPWPSLKSVIDRVPLENVWAIIEQVAAAARFLESRGFVHRDIKPANILLSPDSTRAKLLDLGVIRPLSTPEVDGTDQKGQLPFVATAQYSSPEYLFRLEPPSELMWRALTYYQLGGVLHDLIVGHPLFWEEVETGNKYVVARAVLTKMPQVIRQGADPLLISLARNCLAKEMNQRLARVGWDQFSKRSGSLQEARERLGLAKAHAVSAESSDLIAARRKLDLERLGDRIDMLIREVLLHEQFPRHTVETEFLEAKEQFVVFACFQPAHASRPDTRVGLQIIISRNATDSSRLDLNVNGHLLQGSAVPPRQLGPCIWTILPTEFEMDRQSLYERLTSQLIHLYDRADQQVEIFEQNEGDSIALIKPEG